MPARARPQGGRHVERFAEGHESDLEGRQFLECRDQIDEGSSPTVETPHHHHVELASACGGEQVFALLAQAGARADIPDLQSAEPSPPFHVVAHGRELQGQGLLIVGGDSGVEAGVDATPLWPKTLSFRGLELLGFLRLLSIG